LSADLFGEAADASSHPVRCRRVDEFRQVLAQSCCATRLGDDDRPVGAVVEDRSRLEQPFSRLSQLSGRDPGQAATDVGAYLGTVSGVLDDA
jgi:hypothetical protein